LEIDGDGLADNLRVATEPALPQPVSEDDDMVAAGHCFAFRECATEERANPEQRKEIR